MIYLDHAATTPLDSCVLDKMQPYLTQVYGNPASQHAFGREAAHAVLAARDKIAHITGVSSQELYFTSGATESANTALKGVCLASANRGRHIVISAMEHPSLLNSALDLRAQGFEVTLVNPKADGAVRAEDIAAAIRGDTVFVGVMGANNETGVIQPIEQIYSVCKERGVFFYCDLVQVAGVMPFNKFPADGFGISAHKFYGPKGVGALYINKGFKFVRLISGGEQERGLRGGTTFVAGAIGCAAALENAVENAADNNKKVASLRDRFIKRVLTEIDGTRLNGGNNRLPSNANIAFDGCDGENILFALDLKGIAVSTGSACSSGAVEPSKTLLSMGLGEAVAKSSVRFTFGKYNTAEEVDITVEELKNIVNKIRK